MDVVYDMGLDLCYITNIHIIMMIEENVSSTDYVNVISIVWYFFVLLSPTAYRLKSGFDFTIRIVFKLSVNQ